MARRTSEITARAAYWVVQLRSPDRPPRCEQEFADWLRASPVHVREYLRAVEIWEALAHPAADLGRPPEVLVSEARAANLVEWVPSSDDRHDGDSGTQGETPSLPAARRSGGWQVARVALALLLAGFLGYLGWNHFTVVEVATGVGELRSAVLPDRSIVELNTRSEIRLAYTGAERRVELIRGEAFFVVAKDSNRPFIVSTDVATVRAVGTRFSVYRRAAATLVTVAEGKVLVRDLAAPDQFPDRAGAGSVEVIPGTQAEARPGEPLVTHRADLQRSLAWRERRLIFEGEPLANVVAEFNRYNVLSLVIADPGLQDERISGVFDANDPESLIDFLVKVDHIPVNRHVRGSVLIGNDGNLPERYPTRRLDRS